MVDPKSKLLLDVLDVGDVLSLGRTKVHELIAAGELRTVTIGRRRLIPRASVEEYAARLEAEQQGTPYQSLNEAVAR